MELVKLLLSAGADPVVESHVDSLTAFELASLSGTETEVLRIIACYTFPILCEDSNHAKSFKSLGTPVKLDDRKSPHRILTKLQSIISPRFQNQVHFLANQCFPDSVSSKKKASQLQKEGYSPATAELVVAVITIALVNSLRILLIRKWRLSGKDVKVASEMSEENVVAEGESRKMRLIYPCFISNQLDVLLNKVSEAQFSETFACLSKSNKSWTGGPKLFKTFKEVVKKNVTIQFDDIQNTVKMDEKLSALDDLRSQYSSSKDVVQWRPDGNVEKTLVSHDMAEKIKRRAHLQSILDKERKEIAQLKSELNKIRSQLKSKNELDGEIKKVDDEASIERKNFCYMSKKLEEINYDMPSRITQ